MADVLTLVEDRLRAALGEPDARASVTFLGTERIEVLRFPDAASSVVRYATRGMSAAPMTDPAQALADPERGPRAELVLSLRADGADTDKVLRPLAVLAASPQVEGVVVAPGSALDTGEPLWPAAPFTSVLVGRPGGLVEDLPLDPPREPVRFFPLLPMTPNEAAWKRVHGAEALEQRWLQHGTDLRALQRGSVPL
ncbi:suppressor of fused domain protein [Streptomyces boncukensis]|uniref:Suppressor of fused domain protein n=1 Tax=Streptomyces boncukensis TaxID=2711219 RepID=A0A6G4WYV4_9ACTN|nr:suppressor of fused domain protein [Streptomyces boncukensis]NGO70042.1 suppressor of fused domain protein [Streptomyces boncukensis]